MPGTDRPLTETQIIADLRKQLRQMRLGGGFDPNEDPVVIGNGAVSGSGTVSSPSAGEAGAVAIGATAEADGLNGVAIGSNPWAQHDGAIAIGHTARAFSGTYNIAIGEAARAVGNASVSIGSGSQADNDGATSLGQSAIANAVAATALGHNAAATFINALAVGISTVAAHAHSTAVGAEATTTEDNQLMLGSVFDFVEIPGDSGFAPNGLVLTDMVTATRYIIQIRSGALVLNAAP